MSKNKKKIPSSQRISKRELVQKIISVFNENPDKTFNYKQVSSVLNIKSEMQRMFVGEIMQELNDEEFVVKISRGKYKLNPRAGYIEGTIERRGVKMYLVPDDEGEAIFIPERKTRHALSGDRVKVFLFARRRGQEPEGEVVEILKRSKDTFVGVLEV